MQRAEERVVVEPPAFALPKCLEGCETAGRGPRTRRSEPVERQVERPCLQAPHAGVVHAFRCADAREFVALRRGQGGFAAGVMELLDVTERNEDRVDRHRAEGGIWRALPLLHFVHGQQLNEVERGRPQPLRKRHPIGNLADAPRLP